MAAISDIMLFGLQLSLDLPRDGEVSLREPQGRELVESVEPYCRGVAGSHYNPRTTTIPPRHLGDALGRNSEHSPREIAVRRVFKVLTEELFHGVNPGIQARGFCGTGQTGLCCGLMCISEDFWG